MGHKLGLGEQTLAGAEVELRQRVVKAQRATVSGTARAAKGSGRFKWGNKSGRPHADAPEPQRKQPDEGKKKWPPNSKQTSQTEQQDRGFRSTYTGARVTRTGSWGPPDGRASQQVSGGDGSQLELQLEEEEEEQKQQLLSLKQQARQERKRERDESRQPNLGRQAERSTSSATEQLSSGQQLLPVSAEPQVRPPKLGTQVYVAKLRENERSFSQISPKLMVENDVEICDVELSLLPTTNAPPNETDSRGQMSTTGQQKQQQQNPFQVAWIDRIGGQISLEVREGSLMNCEKQRNYSLSLVAIGCNGLRSNE